jgi:hypothetical protein
MLSSFIFDSYIKVGVKLLLLFVNSDFINKLFSFLTNFSFSPLLSVFIVSEIDILFSIFELLTPKSF